jgi:hypothetical protein
MRCQHTAIHSSDGAIRFAIGDQHFVVDADIAPLIAGGTIHLIGDGTPLRRHYVVVNNSLLHRLVIDAPRHLLADHVNGNTLDNRRENIRLATHSQSSMNRGKHAPATSRFKGVNWRPDICKWQARIKLNRRNIFLGYFTDELQAAMAYDAKARELHGAFARFNFPRDGELSAQS